MSRGHEFVEPLGSPDITYVTDDGDIWMFAGPSMYERSLIDPDAAWFVADHLDPYGWNWLPPSDQWRPEPGVALPPDAIRDIGNAPWLYNEALQEHAMEQMFASGGILSPSPRIPYDYTSPLGGPEAMK